MVEKNNKKLWVEYCEKEITKITPILKKLGFTIDNEQSLICGEKYLMQAVTTASGQKLILFGERDIDKKRVVVKISSDKEGANELKEEHDKREALGKIDFAYKAFFSPKEIMFVKEEEFTISIQSFIEKEISFFDRPTKEQFFLALNSFKSQEGAHATTYKHRKFIKKIFGSKNSDDYLKTFLSFKDKIYKKLPKKTDLHLILDKSEQFLKENKETIEQYGDFLTHTDFVPHNFRVIKDKIYLLDHSSIRFGNKHEGWARFINFMELYNPTLACAFVDYVQKNKAPEESLSLKLMRVYRLGEIIYYYVNTLQKSEGDLLKLNRERIDLWKNILNSVLNNTQINQKIIENYVEKRDSLRSDDEKKRQSLLF